MDQYKLSQDSADFTLIGKLVLSFLLITDDYMIKTVFALKYTLLSELRQTINDFQ